MTATEPSAVPPQQFGNMEANLRFLESTGLLVGDPSILEIGSGTGAMLHQLRQRSFRAEGVELRQAFIDQAQAWYGPLPVRQVTGTALPFPDASFDIVVSFDVLEHIPDTDAHLREVRRLLKPGGSYLLQTPNKWTNVVFETIRWRSFTRWREEHCSLHSLGELRRRLEQRGFTAVRAFDIPVVNDFFRSKVARYTGWPGTLLLRVVNPDRWPLALRTNLYVRATVPPRAES